MSKVYFMAYKNNTILSTDDQFHTGSYNDQDDDDRVSTDTANILS